jgi:hypothetical protein
MYAAGMEAMAEKAGCPDVGASSSGGGRAAAFSGSDTACIWGNAGDGVRMSRLASRQATGSWFAGYLGSHAFVLGI